MLTFRCRFYPLLEPLWWRMRELVFEPKPPPKTRSSGRKRNAHESGGTEDAYGVGCTSSRCCLRPKFHAHWISITIANNSSYAGHRTGHPRPIPLRPRPNPPQDNQAPRKRPRTQQPLHVCRRNRQSNHRPHRPLRRCQSEKRPRHLPTNLGPTHRSHRRTGGQPQHHYRPSRRALDNARPRPSPNLKSLQRTIRLHQHAPPPILPSARSPSPPRRHGSVHHHCSPGAAVHSASLRVGRCAGADGRRTCIPRRADAAGQDAGRDSAGLGTELWLV
jgi:hypothetical protein